MRLFSRKRTTPLNVAILGSGPAGLFAAQAVYDTGNVVHIFSRGEKSKLYGAQYLHAPVPGLDCGDAQQVEYILKGTVDSYRRKVYGEDSGSLQVSPQALQPLHEIWDIRKAYDQVWDQFSGVIKRVEINPESMLTFGVGARFDLIVWSIPLAPFCQLGHRFASKEIWAQGDAPELDLYCSVTVEPWTVVVNGEPSPRWYRASNVFGHRTAEWPAGVKPPIEGLAKVNKPLWNYCDCWMSIGGTRVIRVGRYGTWTKSELSHMAYHWTKAAIETM